MIPMTDSEVKTNHQNVNKHAYMCLCGFRTYPVIKLKQLAGDSSNRRNCVHLCILRVGEWEEGQSFQPSMKCCTQVQPCSHELTFINHHFVFIQPKLEVGT